MIIYALPARLSTAVFLIQKVPFAISGASLVTDYLLRVFVRNSDTERAHSNEDEGGK